MLNIRFNDEAFEIAARILNDGAMPSIPGIGLKGLNVDIERDGTIETYEVVGANQRDDEDEIKLVVRWCNPENFHKPEGPEIRLSWDTTIEVC
jgi:hypothetical protein